MNYTIEEIPRVSIAYFRSTGEYGGEKNKQVMEQLKSWAENQRLLADATILGIPQDDPATTKKEACRYDVGLVIKEGVEVKKPAERGVFQGGIYAVFQLEHTESGVAEFWSSLHQVIESERLVVDKRAIVERYTENLVKNHRCEILVPLQ